VNLLTLVQQATAEMGLQPPTYVVGNPQADTIQQFALLNAAGAEITRSYPWEALNKEYSLTTVYQQIAGSVTVGSNTITGLASTTGIDPTYMVVGLGVPQDTFVVSMTTYTVTLSNVCVANASDTYLFAKCMYSLPSDFDRMTDNTQWDKSKRWQMLGPETPQQWQWIKSGYIATGPRIRYRLMGGQLALWPPLSSNEVLRFEYVSNGWCTDNAGNVKQMFTNDADTCIWPDRLMILGLKMKYFEVKGFDATAYTRDFFNELGVAKTMDSTSPTLSLAPRASSILIDATNIPDSGYGLP
jgi:hypothetical protein